MFVVGSRCLGSGVAGPVWLGQVAHSYFAGSPRVPGRHRPSRRMLWVGFGGYSIWQIAQQNPASSRATATAVRVRRLLRCSNRVQVRYRRRCADQAIAIASGGWPACRSVSVVPMRGRLR